MYTIKAFDPLTASDADYLAALEFSNCIRTVNAGSNTPMLAINHALGFKPYIAWID